MLILALDTTTRAGSAALVRDDLIVGEIEGDPARSHAERLPADLMALLQAHGVALDALDAFAVATGPGSFTGLRIGIATMQGLAFAGQRPLFGISALDVLATVAAGQTGHQVATWVDAWRGEVYAALYVGGREVQPPTVDTPAAILAAIPAGHTLFIGDGAAAYRAVIEAERKTSAAFAAPSTPLLAGTIGRLAAAAAAAGAAPAPHAIRPLYVRRPDAELARSRARGRAAG